MVSLSLRDCLPVGKSLRTVGILRLESRSCMYQLRTIEAKLPPMGRFTMVEKEAARDMKKWARGP